MHNLKKLFDFWSNKIGAPAGNLDSLKNCNNVIFGGESF